VTPLLDRIRRARESGNMEPLVGAIPYASFMGISMRTEGEDVIGTLVASDHLLGNARLGNLHGGATGALLESTAIFQLLWRAETAAIPKTINITLQYLRSGKLRDTFARAEITRLGRRVANVHAVAWQDDPQRPIAAATAHFLLVSDQGD
jgi:uncharacterized protein (TIGR00369 family)